MLTIGRNWAQLTIDTGNPVIKTLCHTLRQAGYRVSSSSMGNQVTSVGVIKMTLINVNPGTADISDIRPLIPDTLKY